jgi:predicted amino acid racemase
MAYLELNRAALHHNFHFMKDTFSRHDKEWGIVTKLLCGNKLFLKELLSLGLTVAFDSRLSNLKNIRALQPDITTAYIKPPPKRLIPKLLDYADITFNTQLSTIQLINQVAADKGIVHKIMIMIEMGDLREGVLREEFIDFYSRVFELKNIEVIGIGTNLNCLNGVLPSYDKLIQLSLYEQLIESSFNTTIPWVSAGTSVVFPMLDMNLVPKGMNHFRIGETLFFGTDLIEEKGVPGMRQDVFRFYAEIVEIMEKPDLMDQPGGTNVAGETPEADTGSPINNTNRALVDSGLLDVQARNLKPLNKDYRIDGASSDMLVLDVGENKEGLNTGGYIPFEVDYMGVLSLMNSKYIEKIVV